MTRIVIGKLLADYCGGEKCYYYPNPGNGGDSLIAVATYQMFDAQEIEYETIDIRREFNAEGKVVVYSGGGNLVRRGLHARDFILRHHQKAKRLIVLPHTIDDHQDLIRNLADNVVVIAREKRTYEFLQNNARGAEIFISEDMALGLDVDLLLGAQPKSVFRSLARRLVNGGVQEKGSQRPARIAKRLYARALELRCTVSPRTSTSLDAFRKDVEGRDFKKPAGNIDLSYVYSYGTHSREAVYTSAYDFLRFIDRYTTVNTDRLHVCIGAALLGKYVNFYANDYYKCEEIYEYSLRRFPNVSWRGAAIPADIR